MTQKQHYEMIKDSVMQQIQQLRVVLDHVERDVKDDNAVLNDLGELQSLPGMLDCRIASLATLRKVRNSKEK